MRGRLSGRTWIPCPESRPAARDPWLLVGATSVRFWTELIKSFCSGVFPMHCIGRLEPFQPTADMPTQVGCGLSGFHHGLHDHLIYKDVVQHARNDHPRWSFNWAETSRRSADRMPKNAIRLQSTTPAFLRLCAFSSSLKPDFLRVLTMW